MFYWGVDEFFALVGISLCLMGTYFAFDLIRVGKGAPKAWYILVAAFMLLVLYQGAHVFYDVTHPDTFDDVALAALLLGFDLLFLAGVALMDVGFRRQMKVISA